MSIYQVMDNLYVHMYIYLLLLKVVRFLSYLMMTKKAPQNGRECRDFHILHANVQRNYR